MNLDLQLRTEIQKAMTNLFGQSVEQLQIQPTNAEFEGSHTLVCFPLAKVSKKGPEQTASAIGEYLVAHSGLVSRFHVVKGFLNLSLRDGVWVDVLQAIQSDSSYGLLPPHGRDIMVEYSSPNTNKPLHLGHLRNNFLGYSVAEIYKALGYRVHKVQIINDRGIHICKSMAAWQRYGGGETPDTSGLKGDKLVGKYYVEFDKHYKAEVKDLMAQGMAEAEAEKNAPMMKLAVELLQKWEAKDPDVLTLWRKMNGWVYAGFESTYQRMGVDFDKLYYESDTYLLGKDEVLKGLAKGVFFQKEDGSVWVDLTADGLDQKVLLRSDGTSVYMTQDIGTAILRFRDFPNIEGQIYTVGNEQEYHFKVLFLILKKLGYAFADQCYHLSYGMVDLPSGKMKSREGTVVDADDLMEEMAQEALEQTRSLGKIDELSEQEVSELAETIGLGALKFFLLKVDPRKRMLFDPNESIQLQGHTGPFIQYTHARIRSVLRKATAPLHRLSSGVALEAAERALIVRLEQYPQKLAEAGRTYSPAVVANYAFDLAKEYNHLYQSLPIFHEADEAKRNLRLVLSDATAQVLARALAVLGIRAPERM